MPGAKPLKPRPPQSPSIPPIPHPGRGRHPLCGNPRRGSTRSMVQPRHQNLPAAAALLLHDRRRAQSVTRHRSHSEGPAAKAGSSGYTPRRKRRSDGVRSAASAAASYPHEDESPWAGAIPDRPAGNRDISPGSESAGIRPESDHSPGHPCEDVRRLLRKPLHRSPASRRPEYAATSHRKPSSASPPHAAPRLSKGRESPTEPPAARFASLCRFPAHPEK